MSDDRPYILAVDTLTEQELGTVGKEMVNWPKNALDLVTGIETAEFLRDIVAFAYNLSPEQQRGVARFVMEIALGRVAANRAAETLSRIAGVDAKTALQITKELEAGLLRPLGFTLSGLTAPAQEPEVVENEQGKPGLRYASVDDLLADIADLSPDGRMKFLQDAKRDNRVIVLQALGQLKLGTDASGRPLAFRELVAQDAPRFSGQDFSDLLATDPDAAAVEPVRQALIRFVQDLPKAMALLATTEKAPAVQAVMGALADQSQSPRVQAYVRHSPLFAAVEGREGSQRSATLESFVVLDQDIRDFLVSSETADILADLVRRGVVPATHAVAVAKLAFLLVTAQVTPEQLVPLLSRLQLSPEQAEMVATELGAMVEPFIARTEVPAPAVTQPPPPRKTASQPVVARNTIDLRKRT